MADELSLASARAVLGAMRDSARVATDLLRDAAEPNGPAALVHPITTSLVPRWHFAMLNDAERNQALADALARSMPPGAHVLDIGSGTGLLAMMAARAGAATVTTCEQNPILAELARQVIAKHGLDDVVTVVPTLSMDLEVGVDLPRPADLIVSEIVDCGLIGEGVLAAIADARSRLLAPGGVLLPASARVFGALLDSPAVDGLNRVRSSAGFDLTMMNLLATRGHFPVRLTTWPHRMLSDRMPLCDFDFATGPLDDGADQICFDVTESGTAHGIVAWFELDLGAGITLCNSVEHPASHWMQAFVPFPEPIGVTRGDAVVSEVRWHTNRISAEQPSVSAS